MPVLLTYEIEKGSSTEHNRVQSFLERLGWESLGGSSYRYPKLGSTVPTEDWFNHVVPALMLFRAFVLRMNSKGKRLKKFSLDVQTSTGCNPGSGYGTLPFSASDPSFGLCTPSKGTFGLKKLKKWIDDVAYPY